MQVLAFNLLNEMMGLDISCVREVLKPHEIHPLPNAPEFIEGVMNLRGRIIAVMDLRKKFKIEAQAAALENRIIVCRVKKFIIGLIVDRVNEVVDLAEQDIQPAQTILSDKIDVGFISGIARAGEKVITLLNLERILSADETEKLSKIKKQ